MNWYFEVFKKYAEFSGRSRRSEYWYFVLFNFIAAILLFALSTAIPGLIVLYFIYALGTLIPSLAVLVRRLHDTNRSGWSILYSLIPFVGGIILIVFLASAGDEGNNYYGHDPKQLQPIGDPNILDSNVI